MLTQENAHYRMPKGGRTRLIAAFVIALLAIGGLWWNAQAKAQRAESARHVAEARAEQLDNASVALQRRTEALLKANHRLILHGQKPVGIPSVPPVATPRVEAPAQVIPTRSQVFAAMQIICSTTSQCRPPGPTLAQAEAGVARYCAAHNECRGPSGTPGIGTPGKDGADGQPGQDASDVQVATFVNAYCDAHNQCQGPPGRDGADSIVPGPKGDKGDKGDPGTATPGTYLCPDVSPFLHGLTVAPDGTLTLDCISLISGNSGTD